MSWSWPEAVAFTGFMGALAAPSVSLNLRPASSDVLEQKDAEIRVLQEELSQWRRTLRQRVKEQPEWDRKTFEETAP